MSENNTVWHKELPTSPGWYWYLSERGISEIVYIYSDMRYTRRNHRGSFCVDESYLWGPKIEPPQEMFRASLPDADMLRLRARVVFLEGVVTTFRARIEVLEAWVAAEEEKGRREFLDEL